jgi:sugar-specific transcriptional regulator TrmB
MDPKMLEEIGLTEGESKVYLALLKLGATKTGPLIKEADVSSSKVYKILER